MNQDKLIDLDKKYKTFEKSLINLNRELYDEPELGYQEFKSVEKIKEFLINNTDIKSFKNSKSTKTGFIGSLNSNNRNHIAICIEFDALPGVGHACGHNIISTSGIGAITLLNEYIKKTNTKLSIIGCPAEEILPLNLDNGGGGGKIRLINEGFFDGVDAALMIHPATRNELNPLMIAVKQLDVVFHGKAAHASGSPYVGKNALDAQIQSYNAISNLRQHLLPTEKVHGIITDGGESANIIPSYTRSSWMIRSQKTSGLKKLEKKVKDCFKSAALATGCKVEILEGYSHYDNLVSNETLTDLFEKNAKIVGRDMRRNTEYDQSKNGSTDMGNVSKIIPSLHSFIQIVDDDGKIVNHQEEFAKASITKRATNGIKDASLIMALTVIDIIENNYFNKL